MKGINRIFLIIIPALLSFCSSSSKNESVPNEDLVPIDSSIVKDIDTTKVAMISEITCPKCSYKKTETMPTDICLLKYTCENCKTEVLAKEDDCCVFCSYGTKKCPSMQ